MIGLGSVVNTVHAVDFDIKIPEVNSEFPTDIAGTPTEKVSWWGSVTGLLSDGADAFADGTEYLWDGACRFFKGSYDAGEDLDTGVVDVIKDPSKLIDGLKAVWDDPNILVDAFIDPIKERIEKGDYAGAFGYGAVNLLEIFIGSKGATKVGKLSKVEKAIDTAGDVPTGSCFIAGTMIQTRDGKKPIEKIRVGDIVLARDEKSGKLGYKQVVHPFIREVDEIYKIFVSGHKIETTAEHPFWVEGKGWTKVKDLREQDQLLTSEGKQLPIQKIIVKKKHTTVYNIEVEGYHTYFVSDLGVFVHNKAMKKMIGADGVQVTSKTIWKEKGSKARIDVENPNPGKRPGQIHYQDANNVKYYFDPYAGTFYDQKTGKSAPKKVQKMLEDKDFVTKLNVGLTKYLGEEPFKP